MENTNNESTIIQPDMSAEVKAYKRTVMKEAVKKFALQVGLSVAAGLASHYILKALTPKDELEADVEFEVIEEITD